MLNPLLNWILPKYKKYKQNRHTTNPVRLEQVMRTLLKKTNYAFLTTHPRADSDDEDYCSSRFVQPIIEWEGHSFKIWIGTHAQSRKIQQIKQNPKVTIAVGHARKGANLIIRGKAQLHTDKNLIRQYWMPVWALFFPDGPASAETILISVVPEKIELMDFSQNIIPEPFGLKPLYLLEQNDRWVAAEGS